MESYLHFLAGWCAGVFGVLVGHPMDTIKIHQQTSNENLTTTDAIKRIMRKNGLRGFYRGMTYPLIHSGILNAIYFGTLNATFTRLQSSRGYEKIHPNNRGWLQDLFYAGCLGGAIQTFVTCPSELIKIRIQMGKGIITRKRRYSVPRVNTFLTLLDFYRRYGIRGFFVGFVPTLWRDTFGGGVYIACYHLTRYNLNVEPNTDPGLLENLIAGGVAGVTSWIPVIPFDTIKSRIQGDNLSKLDYKGMTSCSVDLYKRSSIQGFFKGFLVIVVRSVPVNVAITYGYELALKLYRNAGETRR